MPPMRIENLLPRLELEPVVNGIKVGDTNGAGQNSERANGLQCRRNS